MSGAKNNADRHPHHFIYRTTRIHDGHYYLGMHSTDDLHDGYMGSGRRITSSLKKHGRDAHKFEIIEHLPDRKSLVGREIEVVNEAVLMDPLCMNLIKGGCAPPWPVRGDIRVKLSRVWKGRKRGPMSDEHKRRVSEAKQGQVPWNKGKQLSEEIRQTLSLAHLGSRASVETRLKQSLVKIGKKKSPETRARMALATQRRMQEGKNGCINIKHPVPRDAEDTAIEP